MPMEEAAFFAAVEAVPGVPETILPEHGMAVRTASLPEVEGGPVEVEAITPVHAFRKRRKGVVHLVRGSIEWDLFTQASAGEGWPKQDRFWCASAWLAAVTAGVSVEYRPDPTPAILPAAGEVYPPIAADPTSRYSLTLQKSYQPEGQGNHWAASGCRLSGPTLRGTNDSVIASASFVGAYEPVQRADSIPVPVLEVGDVYDSMDLLVDPLTVFGNTGLMLEEWSLDPQMEPVLRPGPTGPQGHNWPALVQRGRGSLTLIVEATDEVSFDLAAKWVGAEIGDVTMIYLQGSQRMTIQAQECVVTGWTMRDGFPTKYEIQIEPAWDEINPDRYGWSVLLDEKP